MLVSLSFSMHSMLFAPKRTDPSPVPERTIELVMSLSFGKNLWHSISVGRKRMPALSPNKILWYKMNA